MTSEVIQKGNTRRDGSVVYQVNQLLNGLRAFGQSRHCAKQMVRIKGWDRPVALFSFGTVRTYTRRNVQFVKWCRAQYGLRSVADLTQPMVDGYFAELGQRSDSAWTWDTQIAALNKLRAAMELQGIGCAVMPPAPKRRRLKDRIDRTVSYTATEVQQMLDVLKQPYRLMAQVQWETGARQISLQRLHAEDIGPASLRIRGKGGKVQWRPISRNLHAELLRLTADSCWHDRVFVRSYGAYRAALVRACTAAGLPYGGSHALRRSFARRRLGELMRLGQPERKAREIVAKEMGHGGKRGRITWAYAGTDVGQASEANYQHSRRLPTIPRRILERKISRKSKSERRTRFYVLIGSEIESGPTRPPHGLPVDPHQVNS